MTTDDLRTRARQAAEGEYPSMHDEEVSFVRGGEPILREGFIAGYLAHAAQRPTREQIRGAIEFGLTGQCDGDGYGGCTCPDSEPVTNAVLALFDRADR